MNSRPAQSTDPNQSSRRAAKRTEPNETTRVFLQAQRADPYFNVFSVVFAGLVTLLARWMTELLRSPSTIRVDRELEFWMQFLLITAIFMLLVYLWLFFSRIFIYVQEDAMGQAVSFVLCGIVLAGVATMQAYSKYWPLIMSVCILFVGIKVLDIRRNLKDHPEHPIRTNARRWAIWAFASFAVLIGSWFIFNPQFWEHGIHEISAYKIGLLGLPIVVLLIVVVVFPRTEDHITKQMNVYMETVTPTHPTAETENEQS